MIGIEEKFSEPVSNGIGGANPSLAANFGSSVEVVDDAKVLREEGGISLRISVSWSIFSD